MINVLQALMKKADNIQDQIGNFRDIETANQWEMLKIKNIVTEMKIASDRLINRNASCLKGISELEDKTTESTQTENAKGKIKRVSINIYRCVFSIKAEKAD